MDKCLWYKYPIQKQPNKSLNGRGAEPISNSFRWSGRPKERKGSFAEGEHQPGCLSWAVTKYVPDCHESGVLSWVTVN